MKIVGLLRGVNVGKSVKVPMAQLKTLVESTGATNVVTYLNSGNVVFEWSGDRQQRQGLLDQKLEQNFGQRIPLLLLEGDTIRAIHDAIPEAWQNNEHEQTYVAYLFPEIDRADLAAELPVKHQWIEFRSVPSALIWHILRADYNKSQITRIASSKAYDKMTIRNVNTARRLAELVQPSGDRPPVY